MDPTSLVVIAVALTYGAFSRRAERTPLTPPIFFVTVGLALGRRGLGWIAIDVDGPTMHALAELTLGLVLFTDASRIDLTCLRREESLPARLPPVLLLMTREPLRKWVSAREVRGAALVD